LNLIYKKEFYQAVYKELNRKVSRFEIEKFQEQLYKVLGVFDDVVQKLESSPSYKSLINKNEELNAKLKIIFAYTKNIEDLIRILNPN